MDFDNIYNNEEYDDVLFSDIFNRVKSSKFFYPKYMERNSNLSVACEVIELFKTNFFMFNSYLESECIYTKSNKVTSLCSRINHSTRDFFYNSLRSLNMAIANSNVPLSMRIINSIYETLVISTSINYGLVNNDSSELYQSITKRCSVVNKINCSKDSTCISDMKNKLHKNDINSIPPSFEYFYNSLQWLSPLFKDCDENKLSRIFNVPLDSIIKDFNVDDLGKILGIYQFENLHEMTKPFCNYSIVDIYLNNKNPSLTSLDFDEINERGISYYSRYEEALLLDSLKQLPILFEIYFKSIPNMQTEMVSRFSRANYDFVLNPFRTYTTRYPDGENQKPVQIISFEKSNESCYASIVEKFKIQSKLKKGYFVTKEDYYKKLEFCNIDPMFIKIIQGLVPTVSIDEQAFVNNYFTTYKDNYVVSDEAFSIYDNNPRWNDLNSSLFDGFYKNQVNTNSSSKLAYKWQNVFKSLLNGIRFNDINKIPIEANCDFIGLDKGKKVFINYKVDNEYNLKGEFATGQFLISSIQSFVNICNLILINDFASAIRESKKLYESIVLKTYIGFKNSQEAKYAQIEQENLTVFKFLSEAMNHNSINIQLTNDKKELFEQNIFPTKEYNCVIANNYFSRRIPKIIKDMINNNEWFSFADNDDLDSFDDIANYLSNYVGLDLSLSSYDQIYVSNFSLNVPFFSTHCVSDNVMSLLILDFASLLNRTLPYDIITEIVDNKSLTKLMDIVSYMLNEDLGGIDV